MSETPLFVRLPSEEAERLDRAVATLRTSKRELVTRLLVEKLDDVLDGHADFTPSPPAYVLSGAEAPSLRKTDGKPILDVAEAGALPGRKVGSEWRCARAAVLRWLDAGG